MPPGKCAHNVSDINVQFAKAVGYHINCIWDHLLKPSAQGANFSLKAVEKCYKWSPIELSKSEGLKRKCTFNNGKNKYIC